jgi:hypothetical protein
LAIKRKRNHFFVIFKRVTTRETSKILDIKIVSKTKNKVKERKNIWEFKL